MRSPLICYIIPLTICGGGVELGQYVCISCDTERQRTRDHPRSVFVLGKKRAAKNGSLFLYLASPLSLLEACARKGRGRGEGQVKRRKIVHPHHIRIIPTGRSEAAIFGCVNQKPLITNVLKSPGVSITIRPLLSGLYLTVLIYFPIPCILYLFDPPK